MKFFDKLRGRRNAPRRINPHLLAARRSVIKMMQPMLRTAEEGGFLFVNRHQPSLKLTHGQLVAEWKRGRLIQGPLHWRLVKEVK